MRNNFHQNRIITEDFSILTRGGIENPSIVTFYGGACIKILGELPLAIKNQFSSSDESRSLGMGSVEDLVP